MSVSSFFSKMKVSVFPSRYDVFESDEPDELSKEEKIFLLRIWKFEEELDKALEEKNDEKVFLLMCALDTCLHSTWLKHLPNHKEYSATLLFDMLFGSLANPILVNSLKKTKGVCDKLGQKRLRELSEISFEMDEDTREIKIKKILNEFFNFICITRHCIAL